MPTATPARLSFTPCPVNPTPRQLTLAVNRAFAVWTALQERAIHPVGDFDDAGRWYPDASERCECCSAIRSPSRAYPYSLVKHCRSVEHVAARFAVPVALLRKRIARDRPRRVVEHVDHYKAVAVVDDRYLSVYDGTTEYRLGETLSEPCRPDHGGGHYCYPSLDPLLFTNLRRIFPSDSALLDAPMAFLRCKVGGRKIRYSNGKVAFSRITPVAVVAVVTDDNSGTYRIVEREVARA